MLAHFNQVLKGKKGLEVGAAAHQGDAVREAFSSCQPQKLCKIRVVRVEVITERNAAENVLVVCKFGQNTLFWGAAHTLVGRGLEARCGTRGVITAQPLWVWEGWETGSWQRPFKTLSFTHLRL